jgi:CheY-like chemotaxis protein
MVTAEPLRCVIVDDSPDFLRAAARILERDGLAVVGVASTIADALKCVNELRPDVIMVDVYLGAESGFDLAARLDRSEFCSRSAVILTSTHEPQEFADLVAASPAVGFLPKLALSSDAIRDLLTRPPECDPVG